VRRDDRGKTGTRRERRAKRCGVRRPGRRVGHADAARAVDGRPVPAVGGKVGQPRVGRGAGRGGRPVEGGRRGVRNGRRDGRPRARAGFRRERRERGDQGRSGRDGEQRRTRHADARERVRRARPPDGREQGAAVRRHGRRRRRSVLPARLNAFRSSAAAVVPK